MLELEETVLQSIGGSMEAVQALQTYGYHCSGRFDDTNYKFTRYCTSRSQW